MSNSEIARQISALSPERRELLLRRLAAQQGGTTLPSLSPQPRVGPIPLSFAQQRLWFLDQMEPGTPAYNIPLALRLHGPLNTSALEQSLNAIVARHEVLRTTFATHDGQPSQLIAPSLFLPLDVHELQAADSELEARRLATAEAARPFDLSHGPLVRAQLLQLAPADHVLLLNIHHIAADGWSIGVLVRELAAHYQAARQSSAPPLPPLPIQYADYAIWQRQWLQGATLSTQLAYWRERLAGVPALLDLPTDRPRPASRSFAGATQRLTLSAPLSEALAALSQREGATLFMTLLATFKLVLARYSGQDDILVGTPVAGRTRRETEPLIGFFVNTLVLRSDLSGNPTFRELLARVREVVLDALSHQELPFERLVELLGLERDLSHTPLFQVMFVLQNTPLGPLELPDLTLAPLDFETRTAKLDLTLSLVESPQGLRGTLEYNTDIFEASTIARLLASWEQVLAAVVADPERHLADLPLLSPAEEQHLLRQWAAPALLIPATPTVVAMISAQAAQRPAALALACGEQQLSYAELEQRSNQLARHLRHLGVGPEVRVGLLLARSTELVVGLLGVLKAGGTCLVLDPAAPAERLAWMQQDAGIALLLTQAGQAPPPGIPNVPIITLAPDWTLLALEPSSPLPLALAPDNSAYLLYTSGSTGRPKGVLVSHANVAQATSARLSFYREPVAGLLLLPSLAFDAALGGLFWGLCQGGTVILPSDEQAQNPGRLATLIAQARCTHLLGGPALYGLLLQENAAELAPLRVVVVGGEACPWEVVARHRERLPQAALFNEYGPTEATIWSTVYQTEAQREPGPVPIGRPVPGSQLYLLDRWLRPVPWGAPGELYVGGAGVARGYLNRPALTAERFLPDPFSDEPGVRLYRTGDLARARPDGTLAFLGRADQQVKLRGFRIELGEIEGVLAQHPAVREAAVAVQTGQAGSPQLVAYLVGHDGPPLEASEVRRFLQAHLPDYMLPTAFMPLAALPRLPNGKLDRRALPTPDQASRAGASFTAPRTPAETQLAEIWGAVLRLEQVGIHDNFFALGGDSILSIQVVARANQAGLRLSAKQLFQHQTIAELAQVAGSASQLEAQQGEVSGSVLLTPIQQWFFERELPDPHYWNQAVLLEVRAPLPPDRYEQALQHLLAHHDALRLRFVQTPTGWQQQHAPLATQGACLETLNLAGLAPEAQRLAFEQHANRLQASLDLSAGPLLRALLCDFGPDQPARLLLVCHHLVVDGVSWRILLDDLNVLCQQLEAGHAPQLPAKTTAFKQWAERLQALAQSSWVQQQLDFWLAQTTPAPPPLPLDFPAGDNTIASEASVRVTLDVEETRALLQEVPAVYRTQINDVLLTALAQALAPWLGSQSILVDLEGHGREPLFDDLDLSHTVGWFTSSFPLRLLLPASSDPGSALKAIKEQLRQLPERGIGYGLLRYLSADPAVAARLRAQPHPQLAFNYLGQFDQVLAPDARFAPANESSGRAQSPRGPRPHLLGINGMVSGGQLQFAWSYSDQLHQRATIQHLAQAFVGALRRLIDHCRSVGVGGYTPSDFPLAALDQETLDRLVGGDQNVEDLYPLSPMQQGMLYHSLAGEEGSVYFLQLQLTFGAGFDPTAFQQAWRLLLTRQQLFRGAVLWQGLAQPLLLVRRQVALPWEFQDWRGLTTSEQQHQLTVWLEADRAQGFDFASAPLMRLTLIQLADDTWQFIWSHHHLLTDGWSLPLVLKELFSSYTALCEGQTPPLGQPQPYRDYIAWLQQQDLAQAERFWRQTLRGFTAATPLLLGPARGVPTQASTSGEQQALLSEATTAVLQTLARQQQLTLNTIVQGAWALLLQRYSGAPEVLFGATVSGRPADLPGVEEIIGLFINTLPVRVALPPTLPVVDWLRALQAHLVELRQYEYSPLSQVQGWSEVPRGQPLFESLLVFENYPVDTAVRERPHQVPLRDFHSVEQSNYPLNLIVLPGAQFSLKLSYDPRRFDSETVGRMLRHLQTILASFGAAPEQPLAEVALLTPAERQTLLVEWNQTQRPQPEPEPLHRRFEALVAQAPERLALVCGSEQISYQQLNQRANRLAHQLQAQGVGPGVPVGLFVGRDSLALVVGMLGILKAGGAYLPLDPSYPRERLARMLADARPPVILTHEALRAQLPPHQATLLCIAADGTLAGPASDYNPTTAMTVDQWAYLLYTSGSTGQPKGVCCHHRGVLNLLADFERLQPLAPGAAWSLWTSPNFDVSVYEIFSALLSGGTLYLVPEQVRADSGALMAWFTAHQIQSTYIPPFLLAGCLTWLEAAETLPPLRRLLVGVEPIPSALLSALQARLAGLQIINGYGPTEATICATRYPLPAVPPDYAQTPIGRPVQNMRCYLLDRQQQPVPVGVPGELYIGGVGLAHGYLNSPGLTAERFLPDPFSTEPGARLYRTGDLVRAHPNGQLEFVGRLDEQIKLRGFRIELGEIVAALHQHPAVAEAMVLPHPSRTGTAQLVAYLLPQTGHTPQPAELRRFLQDYLPAHMLPASFVLLERWPLTPEGKLDRRALPSPDSGPMPADQGYTAPRTSDEARLAEIWAAVLRRERVGIHDNFFALGGDSILSIQVMAAAKRAGLALSPRQLFEHPTISELAQAVGSTAPLQAEQGEVSGTAPLTPIQHWFFERELPERHHWNQAMLLAVQPPLTRDVCEQALQQLLAHHDALRLRFVQTSTGWQQTHAPLMSHPQILEYLDLTGVPAAQQRAALESQAARLQASLDLSAGPLLRALLCDFGLDQPARLLLVGHHLVVDGVSWRILLDDLNVLCQQLEQGLPPQLPPKTTAFKQWAERLQAFAQSSALRREADFWLAQTAERPTLPLDFPAGDNPITSEQTVWVTLSHEETRSLLQEVPATYESQINDLLLTALTQALTPWLGGQTVLLELEGHGREPLFADLDLSRTVGWFTSLFPLRLQLPASGESLSALASIKQQLRQLPQRGIGYGLLRWLTADPELAERLRTQPQPQIAFNYLGQFDQVLEPQARFSPASESAGPAQSTQGQRPHLLAINGLVSGGQLRFAWSYSNQLHAPTTIQPLAEAFMAALRALIAACLAAPVAAGPSQSAAASLVAIQPVGSKAPFFCVHPADGSVFCYYKLAQALSGEQPFYGLQAPGLMRGERHNYPSIPELATRHLAAVRAVQPTGPYNLGGWSFGGLVVFEMARQLVEQGERVALLAIFDAQSPALLVAPRPLDQADRLVAVAQELAHAASAPLALTSADLRAMAPAEQLAQVLHRLQAARALPADDGAMALHRALADFQAREQVVRGYTPAPYPGKITLFQATESDMDESLHLNAYGHDPDYGWRHFSTHPIELHHVPGTHTTIITGPQVNGLARQLGHCLDALPAGASGGWWRESKLVSS
jgi:amino acid adenylation domain-containing protein/non-ribosomal peptide synthase protein (TIGR01720 family)